MIFEEVNKIYSVLKKFNAVGIDNDAFSLIDLSVFSGSIDKEGFVEKLKEIIEEVKQLTDDFSSGGEEGEEGGFFDSLLDEDAIEAYKTTLGDLEPTQQALILSSQGLTNAQIQQVLVSDELSAAQLNQAMTEAGLLKSKVTLTGAQAQQAAATFMTAEGITAETMAQLGLIAADGTALTGKIKLTGAELAQKAAELGLTEAQIAQLATTLGISVAEKERAVSIIPMLISKMKILIGVIWEQIKATAIWLATTPQGWCVAAIAAITGVVVGFNAFHDTLEETSEKVENLFDTFKSMKSEADANAKTIQSLTSEYKELSKGVNGLGENISLSADQFSRYHEIVNQMAELSPDLVNGWDEQGNAIINLKGNVDELTESYKKAKIEAYNTLINGSEDGEGDASDIIKKYQNTINGYSTFVKHAGAGELLDIAKQFENLKTPEELKKAISIFQQKYHYNGSAFWDTAEYKDMYERLGLNSIGYNATEKDLKEIKKNVKTYLLEIQSQIDSEVSNMQSLADAYLNSFLLQDEDYKDIDENVHTALSRIVNLIDKDIIENSGLDSKQAISNYVQSLLDTIAENGEISDDLVKLFQFEDGDLNIIPFVQELQKKFDELGIEIKLTPLISYELDVKQRLQNSLGKRSDYAEGSDGLKEYSKERNMLYNYTKDFTAEEIELWLEVTNGIKGATNKINEHKKALENSTSLFSKPQMINAINGMSAGFDVLADIYNDIRDGGDFDFTKLDTKKFEDSFEGLKEEYTEFIETISDSPNDINKCQDAFDKLVGAYVASNNILENLTDENANVTAAMLKNMGVANAEAIVLEQLALNKEKAKEETQELADAGIEEASSHIDIANGISIEEQALAQLALSKIAVNNQTIDTSEDVENVITLAKAAGSSAKVLAELAEISRVFSEVESGSGLGKLYLRDGTFSEAKKLLADIESGAYDYEFKIDYSKYGYSSPKDPSGSGSDKDPYVEQFEKELEKLDDLKESGLISEKEYLDKLRDLYIKYFKDREKYIDEFKKYEQQYLQGMYDLYNSAIGAATSVLSRQMDKLGKQRDNEIEQIEKEQEAAEKAIQAQIDKKQEEIDKIQEASEERQREIDLQKAQYNLERLKNQKTRLVYKDGRMTYETDSAEIRDAREEVRQAKEEIQIAKIEKEIDSLEDKLKETTEYYENLKKSTNEYYDSMIDGMQSMIDKWEELSDMMEFAENIETLKSLGISVEDVLSGNTAVFERFKNDYIGITGALNIENEAFLSSLAQAAGMTVDQIIAVSKSFKDFSSGVSDSINGLNNNTNGINGVKTAVDELGTSVEKVTTAISGSGGSSGGAKGTESGATSGTTSSLKGAIEEQTTEALTKIDEQTKAFAGEEDSLEGAVQDVISKVAGGSKASEGGGLATGKNGGLTQPSGISGGSSGDTSSLMGAVEAQTAAALDEDTGIPAQKDAWWELKPPLEEADRLILSIKDTLENMDGKEYTVTLNVNGGGGFDFHSITGKFNGSANVMGTANLQGDWGLEEDGRSLVGK